MSTDGFVVELGQMMIAAVLAVIAWLLKVAAGRHIESLDRLSSRVEMLASDVHSMKADIRVLAERIQHVEDRKP